MSTIKVPDTITKLNPGDTYPVVEGADVGGFPALKAEVEKNTTTIAKQVTVVQELGKTGKTVLITNKGDSTPQFPKEQHGNYVVVQKDQTQDVTIELPAPTGGMIDGAIFSAFNQSATQPMTVLSTGTSKIVGGGSVTIPPEHFGTYVYHLADDEYIELEQGYIPKARLNLANYIEKKLEADGKLGSKISVEGTDYGTPVEIDFEGFTAEVDPQEPNKLTIGAKGGGAGLAEVGMQWGDYRTAYGVDTINLLPPLEAVLATPDSPGGTTDKTSKSVALALNPAIYEPKQSEGYLAYFDDDVMITGKQGPKAGGIHKGVIFPMQVEYGIHNMYITQDLTKKAITVQQTDDSDPSVTGGTAMFLGAHVAFKGSAPADGSITLVFFDRDTNSILFDDDGLPIGRTKALKKGDLFGFIDCYAIYMAKQNVDIAYSIWHTFEDTVFLVKDHIEGRSGIVIQALEKGAALSPAFIQYQLGIQRTIDIERKYFGPDIFSLGWFMKYDQPRQDIKPYDGQYSTDGMVFSNPTDCKVEIQQDFMGITNKDTETPCFFGMGGVLNNEYTTALRGKIVNVLAKVTSIVDKSFINMVKYKGDLSKVNPVKIITGYTGSAATYADGWELVNGDIIAKYDDAVMPNQNYEFKIPEDADLVAFLVQPFNAAAVNTLIYEVAVSAKTPFTTYLINIPFHSQEARIGFNKNEVKYNTSGAHFEINSTPTNLALGDTAHKTGSADVELRVTEEDEKAYKGYFVADKDCQATFHCYVNAWPGRGVQKGGSSTGHCYFVDADGRTIDGTQSPDITVNYVAPADLSSSPGVSADWSFTLDMTKGEKVRPMAICDADDGLHLWSHNGRPAGSVVIYTTDLPSPVSEDIPENPYGEFDNTFTGQTFLNKTVSGISATFPLMANKNEKVELISASRGEKPAVVTSWKYDPEKQLFHVAFKTPGTTELMIGVLSRSR